MTKHIMIDIETWGTGPDALIISIGACAADPLDPEYVYNEGDFFEVGIDPRMSIAGKWGEVTGDTLLWWMDPQRDAARAAWLAMEKFDLATAMHGFLTWYEFNSRNGDPQAEPKSIPVWGNGATFDLVIMRRTMEKISRECPWKFWDEKCYRTLKSLPGIVPPPPMPHGMEAHTALGDAVRQMNHLRQIYQQLGMQRAPLDPGSSILEG